MKWFLRDRKKVLPLLLLAFLIAACAPKVIPEELERKIDKKLTFEAVQQNPDAFQGRTILVGGDIIEVRNLKDKTEIEVLQKPLGSDRAPLPVDESGGRFILIHPSFLDPSIFKSGRRITAVAVVKGGQTERIGDSERVYPILEDEHLHLWPEGYGRRSEPSIGIGFGFGAIFSR